MENNDKRYNLIGIINNFDVKPEFVTPIFECEGKYYTQISYDHLVITGFEMLTDLIEYISPISKFKGVTLPKYYNHYVGDDYLVGFQIDDKQLFIGDTNSFIEFTKTFETDDEYIKVAISDFIEEVNQMKLLKK